MLKLLNDDTLVVARLHRDSVTDGVFVFEGKNYFVVSSSSHSTKNGLARHHVEGAFERVVQDTSDHRVSLVNQLSEGLLFVDGSKDHLMLSLLADHFNRRRLSVMASGHR